LTEDARTGTKRWVVVVCLAPSRGSSRSSIWSRSGCSCRASRRAGHRRQTANVKASRKSFGGAVLATGPQHPSLRSNVWATVLPVRRVSALPGHGCRGRGRLSSAALLLLCLRRSLAGKGARLTERRAHDLDQVARLGDFSLTM
jgi:hypothetical protein